MALHSHGCVHAVNRQQFNGESIRLCVTENLLSGFARGRGILQCPEGLSYKFLHGRCIRYPGVKNSGVYHPNLRDNFYGAIAKRLVGKLVKLQDVKI